VGGPSRNVKGLFPREELRDFSIMPASFQYCRTSSPMAFKLLFVSICSYTVCGISKSGETLRGKTPITYRIHHTDPILLLTGIVPYS
jgi:hypothetical protein